MFRKETLTQVLSLVDKICDMQSTDCRSLNKADLGYELLNIAGIENATIHEIPHDWDRQVCIDYTVKDKGSDFSLFAGVSDNKFCFEISIINHSAGREILIKDLTK